MNYLILANILLQVPQINSSGTSIFESLAFNYGVLGIFTIVLTIVIRYLWNFIKATINDLKAENKELKLDFNKLREKFDALSDRNISVIDNFAQQVSKNISLYERIYSVVEKILQKIEINEYQSNNNHNDKKDR